MNTSPGNKNLRKYFDLLLLCTVIIAAALLTYVFAEFSARFNVVISDLHSLADNKIGYYGSEEVSLTLATCISRLISLKSLANNVAFFLGPTSIFFSLILLIYSDAHKALKVAVFFIVIVFNIISYMV